jgi:hypothetical protein
LEKRRVPTLRLEEIIQEIFHVRLGQRRGRFFRQGQRWTLLRRRLPPALNFSSQAIPSSQMVNWNTPGLAP